METMITKNFFFKEFSCRCGSCLFADGYQFNKSFVRSLQNIRDYIDEPMSVSSGLRCYKHNKNVGGVSDSEHKTGKAADIICTSAVKRYGIVRRGLELGLTVGITKSFIHLDMRDVPKLFLY